MITFKGSRNDDDGSGLEKKEGTTENKDEELIVNKENLKNKSSTYILTFKANTEVKGHGNEETTLVS